MSKGIFGTGEEHRYPCFMLVGVYRAVTYHKTRYIGDFVAGACGERTNLNIMISGPKLKHKDPTFPFPLIVLAGNRAVKGLGVYKIIWGVLYFSIFKKEGETASWHIRRKPRTLPMMSCVGN